MREIANSFLVATQFLTRLPVRPRRFSSERLAASTVFFPVVGLLVGAGGVLLHLILSPYVNRSVVAVVILIYLVAVTGGLHEDALADAADGFGGGWEREQVLAIMRDSRIGSFGAIALVLGLLGRFVFLTNLPAQRFTGYLLAGQVLSRWTTLPLAYFLPSARVGDGQGGPIAQRVSAGSLVLGTLLSVGIIAFFLKLRTAWLLLVALGVVVLTGAYYRRRLGGVTGDCFGATIQITELAVYFSGVMLG
ncbi:MAG TPA: adenosylcobinamide-GDP ribazoletransferase [Terriglobales bacterium]|nr:adenosylcobinamide-GDP ribazoletransferase [Terriglobales bacterium]